MSNREPIRKYDANGNCIHFKNSIGFEAWYEYDANGNMIHFKDYTGFEVWKEYDANGNLIHYKNNNGYEKWKEYDANGNMIHFKNSNGHDEWYDSEGNVIDRPQDREYNSTMNDTQDQLWAMGEKIDQLTAENKALKIKIQEYECKQEKERIQQILQDAFDVIDSIQYDYPFGSSCIQKLIDEFNKLYEISDLKDQ